MSSAIRKPWQEEWLVPAIWVGLFLLLLLPLVVNSFLPLFTPQTSGIIFPFVVGKATYFRGLTEIMFVLWVPLAVASPRYRVGKSWILLIFGLFLAVNLAAALAGVSFQRSFWGDYRRMGGVFDLVHWFLLLLILTAVVKNTVSWRRLLNANLVVSLVVALLGFVQHYQIDVFQSSLWYLEAKERLDITLGNATYVGAYMLVNVLIATAFLADSFVRRVAVPSQARRERRRRQARREEVAYGLLGMRIFWVAVILLGTWVMLLSGTRGAVIGLGGGLLFAAAAYALLGSRKRLKRGMGVATVVLVLAVVSFPLVRQTAVYEKLASANVTLERLGALSLTEGSGSDRLLISRIALEAFANRPLLGWGPENFLYAFQRYLKLVDMPNWILGDQAHNRVVSELTTTGVVGFAAYMLLWAWMGRVLYRKIRLDREEDVLTVLLGAALVGYFIQNLFLFDVHPTFLQAVLLIGWLASSEVGFQATVAAGLEATGPPEATRRGAQRERSVAQGAEGGRTGAAALLRWLDPDTSVGNAARWAGAILLVAFLVTSLSFSIYRPYRAAQVFPTGQLDWQELSAAAGESFATFPPMAGMTRMIFFDTVVANWDVLSGAGIVEILARVQPEETVALQNDPRDPQLYLALGKVYQLAAESDPQYIERARGYVDTAQELAPELVETLLLMVSQEILEEDYQEAIDILARHYHDASYQLFRDSRELESKAKAGLANQNQ